MEASPSSLRHWRSQRRLRGKPVDVVKCQNVHVVVVVDDDDDDVVVVVVG